MEPLLKTGIWGVKEGAGEKMNWGKKERGAEEQSDLGSWVLSFDEFPQKSHLFQLAVVAVVFDAADWGFRQLPLGLHCRRRFFCCFSATLLLVTEIEAGGRGDVGVDKKGSDALLRRWDELRH